MSLAITYRAVNLGSPRFLCDLFHYSNVKFRTVKTFKTIIGIKFDMQTRANTSSYAMS